MSIEQPKGLAKNVKRRKNVLLVTGELCNTIDFDGGKTLLDYAVDIARKLRGPVAACGNTVVGLKQKGITRTKKMWVGEVVAFMRDPWMDPIMKERPDALVFIGYNPSAAGWLASMVKSCETVALCYSSVPEATHSLPDTASLHQYQRNLEDFVRSL